MGRYVLKRILIFIPVLLIISLLSFWLSEMAPGDRVLDHCGEDLSQTEYDRCARLYQLDRPAFYLSIQPKAFPDTIYRFVRPYHRSRIKALAAQAGTWPPVAKYDEQLLQFGKTLDELPDSLDRQWCIDIQSSFNALLTAEKPARIRGELANLSELDTMQGVPAFQNNLQGLDEAFNAIQFEKRGRGMLIPRMIWHGADNRYHSWLSRFLVLDFGTSFRDAQPVARKVGKALYWTILINICSFLLAFLIAIPVGVRSAIRPGGRFDRYSSLILFMFYSLPRFWVATILIVFFTTSYYGGWLDWFPSIGLGDVSDSASWGSRFRIRASHLILPVICQAYGLLAFISRQMRGGMLDAIRQDYIRTARAKGLPENQVIWKHAFRNALFPMITILGSVIPAAVAGSVIIEVIFAIPGMGGLMFDSVFANDWPVLFAGLMLGAVFTLVGILVADILYAWADPRVRLGTSKTSEAS